jgi:hypothetical protein
MEGNTKSGPECVAFAALGFTSWVAQDGQRGGERNVSLSLLALPSNVNYYRVDVVCKESTIRIRSEFICLCTNFI